MKVHCDVIQDLLPLYSDGVCSKESREIVENHLRSCESCRNELKMTEAAYENRLPHPNDEKMVEAASVGWKKAKKRYLFNVTTAIIIAMAVICVVICARQTAYLISYQDAFVAEHPTYVGHSWRLLAFLLASALFACGQVVLLHKRGMMLGSQVLCCAMSVAMIVLDVFALRASADQHYHMGMLISDYGIQVPFEGGWMLLLLGVALIVATITQLLIVIFSALLRYEGA